MLKLELAFELPTKYITTTPVMAASQVAYDVILGLRSMLSML
jgi:hypothetical protein